MDKITPASRRLPEIYAAVAACLAVLALGGWLMGLSYLAGGWATYIPMAPSTAIVSLLLAAGLFCFARWPEVQSRRLICLIATSIVFLLSLLVLAQFATGFDLGVEQLLSRTNQLVGSTPLGRMSPLSAVGFLFESAALFLLVRKQWRSTAAAAALLAAIATGINAVFLIGYAFGVPLLYGGTIIPVALPTAVVFVLLGLGLFTLAAPSIGILRDWSGTSLRGILLRAFLPFMLIYVVLDSWVDTKFSPYHAFNPALWDALSALTASLLIIGMIGWIARRTSSEIERAQTALAESEEHYQLLFENSGEAILFAHPDGTIYSANPEACRILGRSENEIRKLGRDGILDPGDPRLQALKEERLKTGKYKGELNLLKRDGTVFPGEISTINFKDSRGVEGTSIIFRDLSERKQAEKRLIESEAKFRNVFEHSPLGKSLTGVDGTLVVNQAFSDIVGYSEQELRTKKWKEITHPDDVQINLDAMQALLDGKISRAQFEKRYIRKDGSLVWTDVVTVIERDESGKPLYFLTTISDISERKQAEAVLQQSLGQITHGRNTLQALSLAAQAAQRAHTSEAIYQAMGNEVKKLGFEMIIVELDIEKREMNAGFVTYAEGLMTTAETLVGVSAKTYHFPLVPGGYYDQVLSAGKAVLYPDATKITAEILPPLLRPLARQLLAILKTTQGIYATLVVNNQPYGFLVVLGNELGETDIPAVDILAAQASIALENARLFQAVELELAERKRADEALRESEKRFRVLIENSSDAITLLDANGVVMYDSPAAPGMLGYGSDELIGQNAFTLLHPDDLPKIRELLQKLGATPNARMSSEFRLQNKSGSWVWIEAVATNLLAEPGVKAIVLNYRDVTPRMLGQERGLRQLEHLTALREIDHAISSSFDLQLSLDTLLVHVIAQLGADATDILLFDTASQTLEYAAGQGFRTQTMNNTPIQLSKGHAARAVLNQRPVFIPDLGKQPDDSLRSALFLSEKFASYYAVPLRAKGELNGVLEIFQRSPLEPAPEWVDFLNTLAGQAGIAIDNANLFKSLQRSNSELVLAYDATIEGWSHALDLRDKETEGHTLRVTEMTLELARSFNLTQEELMQVRRGALLHDIGKMGVPDGVLLKAGSLTEEEWVTMKKHPDFAYEMLSPIGYLHAALDIPYCHHEKWDGTGYPRGLKGEQIPLAARIFAVVDVWDALRSDRPYRPAWPANKVLEHIRSLSGTHLDPQVVEIFMRMLNAAGTIQTLPRRNTSRGV